MRMEPYNPETDPLLSSDVALLSKNIQVCLDSIANTRLLIIEYCDLFKQQNRHMGEDANEIIKQHYEQGAKCLGSYHTIVSLIEKLIRAIDLESIAKKIANVQIKTNESEKRFYFLESRVRML